MFCLYAQKNDFSAHVYKAIEFYMFKNPLACWQTLFCLYPQSLQNNL